MTLHDPLWLTFGGEPVTGHVPVQVVVYGPPGAAMTGVQQGEVQRALAAFSMMVNVSPFPLGYHFHQTKLADGSTVRLTSNNGQRTVQVWISGGGGNVLYRGFVIVPKWVNGALPTMTWKNALLSLATDTSGDVRWRRWVTPYPAGKEVGVSYSVRPRLTLKKVGTQQTDPFYDVHLWAGNKLFINGENRGGMPTNSGTPLYVLPPATAEQTTLYFSNDFSNLYYLPRNAASGTAIYTFDPINTTYSAEARAAPIFDENAATVEMNTQILTPAGGWQRYGALVALLREPPWVGTVTSYFSRMDVLSSFPFYGGYSSVATSTPTTPLTTPIDANVNITGWIYPSAPLDEVVYSNCSGFTRGSGFTPVGNEELKTINRTQTDTPQVATIEGSVVATCTRYVAVNLTYRNRAFTNWLNKWSGPPVLTAIIRLDRESYDYYSGLGVQYQLIPPVLGGGVISSGDNVNAAFDETGGDMVQSDTTQSLTTLSTGEELYRAETTHSTVQNQWYRHEIINDVPLQPQAVGASVWYDENSDPHLTGWSFLRLPSGGSRNFYYSGSSRVETLSVTASARDYLFVDKVNDVVVFVESLLTGTWNQTSGSPETGSYELRCRLKLKSGANEYAGPDRVFVRDRVGGSLQAPPDIDFGTSDFTWQTVSPQRAFPVYYPIWRDQGACPFLAYTTVEEKSHGCRDEMVASFFLQFQAVSRGSLEFTYIPGARQVRLLMLEQLAMNFSTGLALDLLLEIESAPFELNVSEPGNVLSDLAIPGTNTNMEFYRS